MMGILLPHTMETLGCVRENSSLRAALSPVVTLLSSAAWELPQMGEYDSPPAASTPLFSSSLLPIYWKVGGRVARVEIE